MKSGKLIGDATAVFASNSTNQMVTDWVYLNSFI